MSIYCANYATLNEQILTGIIYEIQVSGRADNQIKFIKIFLKFCDIIISFYKKPCDNIKDLNSKFSRKL